MASPQLDARAPRKKLGGSVLALILLPNSRQIVAKVHQLSVSGGMLNLDKPLDEGVKVNLIFHIGASTVRAQTEMLFPMWATQGCLQPFRFVELADAEREKLDAELQKLGNVASS